MKHPQQILPAVAAIIFNEAGELLLQKRGDVGQWCILSGHVEFGETVEEALRREIFEETQARAEIVRFIGVYSSPLSQTYYYDDRHVQYVTTYFEARFTEPVDLHFVNGETRELRFFHPEHLPADLAQLPTQWLADARHQPGTVFLR